MTANLIDGLDKILFYLFIQSVEVPAAWKTSIFNLQIWFIQNWEWVKAIVSAAPSLLVWLMQFPASQKAAELSLQADLQLAGTWYFRLGLCPDCHSI